MVQDRCNMTWLRPTTSWLLQAAFSQGRCCVARHMYVITAKSLQGRLCAAVPETHGLGPMLGQANYSRLIHGSIVNVQAQFPV